MTYAEFKNQGECTPDSLIAGHYPRIERLITIATSANLKRGSVLGRITANGKFILSASAASDGSQIPDAILAEDIDASVSDKQAVVYFSGDFNETVLTLGAGHSIEAIKPNLRNKSIYLRKNQA